MSEEKAALVTTKVHPLPPVPQEKEWNKAMEAHDFLLSLLESRGFPLTGTEQRGFNWHLVLDQSWNVSGVVEHQKGPCTGAPAGLTCCLLLGV